jgi:hypothetical protein
MPAALVMQPTINTALGAPASGAYAQGRAAVLNANNLLAAVEASGLLDGLSAAQKQEVRDILRNLPPAVDSQFMATLKGALQNNQRVQFTWSAHPTGGYDFHHTTAADNTLWLTLRTPPGIAT